MCRFASAVLTQPLWIPACAGMTGKVAEMTWKVEGMTWKVAEMTGFCGEFHHPAIAKLGSGAGISSVDDSVSNTIRSSTMLIRM